MRKKRGINGIITRALLLIASAAMIFAFAGCSDVLDSLEQFLGESYDFKIPDGGMAAVFIDVGQGDATLLQFPDGTFALIDAGTPESRTALIEDMERRGVQSLAFAVGTHPHADHIGGMAEVLNKFGADAYYMPDYPATSKTFSNVLDALEQNDIHTETPKVGQKLYDKDGTRVTVVYNGDGAQDANNASIVLRVECGKSALLLTGDLEAEGEKLLISSGEETSAQLLKVGHHGSRTSSSKEFLQLVKPEIAVIQVGKDNSYKHPAADTLKRLGKMGAEIYRNDELGDIAAVSDGKEWTIQ